MSLHLPPKKARVGIGYDVHRLVEGRKLVLGGVQIDHPTGLLGHSDADVVTHAVMSALLGAMALGSLGDHFPDTDPKYEGASSIDLLKEVYSMMEQRGYTLGNLDVMVICDSPRLAPYIPQMRMNLSNALRVPIECISVKATSTEGLGFTGRAEGIAAQAVCLLRPALSEKKKPYGEEEKRTRVRSEVTPLPDTLPHDLKDCVARVDGASLGNPGPSGIGIVFETPQGEILGEFTEAIGQKTNNEAEYLAAIKAAELAQKWGIEKLVILTDSELLARQINGSYKVRNPRILNLYSKLMELLASFKAWRVDQVRREDNERADYLSRLTLEKVI